MKKKYRKIPRARRINSVKNLIYTINEALLILIKHELITIRTSKKEVINTIINYMSDAEVLKSQYNPPYYLQDGFYASMSDDMKV